MELGFIGLVGESDVEDESEKGSKENLQVPNCRTGRTVEDGLTGSKAPFWTLCLRYAWGIQMKRPSGSCTHTELVLRRV